MTTTHPDNATTWRDLADQLTPQQVAELEYCECEQIPPGLASPQGHLNCARAMVRRNLNQALCADIAAPAEAAGDVYEWEEWDDDRLGRLYDVSRREVGDFCAVEVNGVQFNDGSIERSILLLIEDATLTAQQARVIATALAEAVGDLEQLAGLR